MRAMIGAHASFTLSTETLAACADLAREAGLGLHIHVAEDAADEADAIARFGRSVVRRLGELGALDGRALLAHGVHLGGDEIELIATAGATVVHNPRSNMNNGVGRAPVGALGERLALGTDGLGGDLFEETRVAYLRRREEDVSIGPGWAVARLAQGARVAGDAFEEPLLGRVDPGAPADLAVLEYAAPTPLDDGDLADHWIFGLTSAAVRDVVVGGELVVAGRRLTRVDGDEIAATARAAAGQLWARLEDVPAHSFSLPGLRGPARTGGDS
jgi:cytosine/adenosine deaminase-related metal-dependent hydrolase